MKKVLIIAVSLSLVTPSYSAVVGTEETEMPIKPTKQKNGIHFKVRSQRLKGPKAKNRQVWKDRAARRPLEVGAVSTKGRKGAKALKGARS